MLGEAGITFAFAAAFHPGFRHAGPVRAELGVPTVFNFLGPLCNPARPEASAVGVAHLDRVPLIVGVFQTRGATALVFRGDDGLDELTTTGHSHMWEVSRGTVKEHDLDPRELGIARATIDDLDGRRCRAQRRDRARGARGGAGAGARHRRAERRSRPRRRSSSRRIRRQFQRAILDRFRDKMAVAEEAIDSGAAAAQARAVDRRDEVLTADDDRRSTGRRDDDGPADARGALRLLASAVRHVVVDPVEGLRDGLLPEPDLAVALCRRPSAGVQRESSCQLARRSSRPDQNPTASPAA